MNKKTEEMGVLPGWSSPPELQMTKSKKPTFPSLLCKSECHQTPALGVFCLPEPNLVQSSEQSSLKFILCSRGRDIRRQTLISQSATAMGESQGRCWTSQQV
ncbi:hypothetical protein VTL71DRAFT_6394 [Oculimacula yallundae]|uniref:Uncharacterized protein n=1 Tax=Oculimacula yallundae TaxID=86028 RepID=A0ABR4BWU9_9HELO